MNLMVKKSCHNMNLMIIKIWSSNKSDGQEISGYEKNLKVRRFVVMKRTLWPDYFYHDKINHHDFKYMIDYLKDMTYIYRQPGLKNISLKLNEGGDL